jgi:hypothetical protein
MSAAAPRPPSAVSGASGSGASGEATTVLCRAAGRSAPMRRPRTRGGLFLRATATHDRAEAVSVEDAREVFARAFVLAVGLRFAPETPLPVIAGSVAACARRQAEPTLPVREAEMLVREALGETVPTAGIAPAQRVAVQVLLFAALVEELALTDDELDELIADAEDGAGDPG